MPAITAKLLFPFAVLFSFGVTDIRSQTLFAPSGTVGSSGNGNVGVGTTSPRQNLEVGAQSNPSINIHDFGTAELTLGINESLPIAQFNTNSGGFRFVVGQDGINFPGTGSEVVRFSNSGNVGIGTISPDAKLDVAGDIRSTGNLVEKKVVFTPTTAGWYRIVSGLGGLGWGQAGGTIRTVGTYDGCTTALEFIYNIRGWGQGSALTLTKNTGVNGNIIDQARVSTDGGGSMYLDLHVSTASVPAPITIYGYGPDMPSFVATPVVGATAGSTDVRVLPIGYSVGGYDDFRTTGNMVTYSSDGSTPQGYIYHGSSGQAAFGNGIINGETWITRTGGAGSIKLGDYDLNTAYLTVAGGSGNVGIGTTNPTHKLSVNGTIKAKEVIVETTGWSDYVFADDYSLAPLAEVEAHIKEHKHLPGIPSAAQVAETGISLGDMQAKLLAKIEELTLHQIELEKRLASQAVRIDTLERENERLQTRR